DRVVDRAFLVPHLRLAFHAGNEEQVDQPADAQQAERQEPDGAGDRLAVIEPMRAGKTKQPQNVADNEVMRVVLRMHDSLRRLNQRAPAAPRKSDSPAAAVS